MKNLLSEISKSLKLLQQNNSYVYPASVLFVGIFTIFTIFIDHKVNSKELNKLEKTEFHDEILIESDRQSSDSSSGVFTAYGNVRIVYPDKDIVATSKQVQYLKNESIIILMGDVYLIREGSKSLKGERLVYFLDDDRIIVDSHIESQVLLKFNLDSYKSNERYSPL